MAKNAKQEVSCDIVLALASATVADLDALDAEIAEKESVLLGVTVAAKAEIKTLQEARRLVAMKLGLDAPKKPAGKGGRPRKNADGGSAMADAVYKLLTDEGSLPLTQIAGRLNTTPAGVSKVIGASAVKDWFRRDSNGDVSIARAGM